MSKKTADNWLALAEYDLETAKAMLATKRYLYVAFMCQQALEKTLKACYVLQHGRTPPYTHNLLRLAAELAFAQDLTGDRREHIEVLNSYYVESRYTEDMEAMMKAINEEKAKALFTSTEEVFRWLKSRM